MKYTVSRSFNSRPHKEVDYKQMMNPIALLPFNSRPHKEVDVGPHDPILIDRPFNSRPHKEVDCSLSVIRVSIRPFNSRPHKEVDELEGGPMYRHILSIHDLTRRSTASIAK